jgi:3-demethoxyubiquinol 3-hydroxylase
MYKNDIHEIIRVDHAGELGAKWIYEGQLRWMKNAATREEIQHMYHQEKVHLDYFESLMQARHVRPTILMPVWKWMARTAGAISAMLGPQAAMACTEAVEDVIDLHYLDQINTLEAEHPEEADLIETLKKFREDECNHRDTAAEYDQNPTLVRQIFKRAIKIGVHTAITLSKRI